MSPDPKKLEAFVGRMIKDLGAAAAGALVIIGDRLGLYRALSRGPATSEELAQRTGVAERYLREWLAAQAASGYIEFDSASGQFSMTPEQAAVLTNPDSPYLMTGGFYSVASLYKDEPTVSRAFQTGHGVGWHEHSECLFCGTERFFGPTYRAMLVDAWIPALDGVQEQLRAGARVADIGCGHGLSTLIMARAFPKSTFHGYDYHDGSIERARELAAKEGVANVEFRVSDAKIVPHERYQLATFFDCLHDMGDPVGAARRVRDVLTPDGTLMVVEPLAGDRLEENLHPVGRLYYCFSTMVCTPASLSQEVGLALGAQAGEKRLSEVLHEAGFSRVRRVAETPANMVLEARA
ncbi:MAG: methyltransferase domain-containing protein [Planctomycetia bacterium]|nr:methyltransferase domain-containing protein [Planctomycetia bacterium]